MILYEAATIILTIICTVCVVEYIHEVAKHEAFEEASEYPNACSAREILAPMTYQEIR